MYQKGEDMVGPDAILGEAIIARIEAQQSEGATPIKLNWINRTYATLDEAVKSHEVNMALGVYTFTEERKQEIAFSNPYNELDLAAAYNPINLVVQDTSSLGAAKLGIAQADTFYTKGAQIDAAALGQGKPMGCKVNRNLPGSRQLS